MHAIALARLAHHLPRFFAHLTRAKNQMPARFAVLGLGGLFLKL